VACTGQATCLAVGYYTDTADRLEPMAATENRGRWSRAVALSLPANASRTVEQRAFLESVACQRKGYCTAVGDYVERSGNNATMAITESGGRWRRPVEIKPPRGASPADGADLSSVSCTGPRSCIAVGYYDSAIKAMAASESAGRWARAQAVSALPPKADATQPYTLSAVSCAKAGDCVAVGSYTDKAGTERIWMVSESAGHWVRPRQILLPANAATGALSDAAAFGVDCTASGYCAADGLYNTRSSIVTAIVADFPSR
jgi:hypothetical protein